MIERDPVHSADVAEKFRAFAVSRDATIRDELVEIHLGLAVQLARRFANRGEPLDDLVQAASIGLIKAVDRFDPDLGFEFSAYATRTIVGELKRHFHDRGWAIRAPRRVQELYLEIGALVAELSQQLGRSPTVRELSESSGASEEEVIEALEAGNSYRSASLDAPSPEGEPMANRISSFTKDFSNVEARAMLQPHLAALPERERVVIEMRFIEDLTQSEIASRLGISQMHVSRLLSRSLSSLHAAYGTED